MDVGRKLAANAEAFPERTAIIFNDKHTSYAQLNDRSVRLANALIAMGIEKRQKVATVMRNRSEYLEIIYGLAKAGITHVPINWRFAPEEMRHVISNSESTAVIVAEEFRDKIEKIKNDLDMIEDSGYILLDGDGSSGVNDYEKLLESSSTDDPAVENKPGDPFFIGYTSGTTGFPKGAVTPHGDWDAKSLLMPALFRMAPDAVQLITMPLFHMNAINTASISHHAGHTVVVMERFRPEEALRCIQEHKCNFSSMVPTMYNRFKSMDQEVFKKYDTSSLTSLLQSSAPLPFTTKQWVIENFPATGLHEVYGGTEAGMVAYMPPEEQLNRPGSVGRALPGIEVKLLDDDGNEVPQGEVGQIASKPQEITDGAVTEYYKDDKSTQKSFKKGWFYSGDMACQDEDGFLYLVDRKFDMIISGGENIYPKEIETVLYKHPAVNVAAVIGIPDDEWGEQVKAVLVLKKGKDATEEEIISYCREHLAGYKVPRSVDFRDELPETDTGKILKKLIKAPYWEGKLSQKKERASRQGVRR